MIRSISKDQLFSTKPRLARSGSKTKLEKSQLPPTDTSGDKTHRSTNSYGEVVSRGYLDEKQQSVTKPRAKIIKGT